MIEEAEEINWWVNVAVCDAHWGVIAENRVPVRSVGIDATCIRCDEPADIWVRANLRVAKR